MKTLLLALTCTLGLTASAQIRNSSFETGRDTAAQLPKEWGFRQTRGYSLAIDDKVAHSGSRSMRIASTNDSLGAAFAPFSQIVEVDVPGLKKLSISVWMKLQDASGGGGLWCQIWNAENKQIGFKNLESQGGDPKGTADWKKYTLNLVVNSDCKKLLLGGYLSKTGTVWYDDFSIEEPATATTPPSKDARRYADAFRKIVKENSIYSAALNWNSLDSNINLMLAGAQTYADAADVSGYILSKLREQGDNHSFVMSAQRSEQNAKENTDGRKPTSRLLNAHTGYINVPGIMSINDAALTDFAQQIQSQIRALDSAQAISSWVVDLRENTGGNMYPMIAGLGPLIGTGDAGYFVTSEAKNSWFYRDGKCGAGKQTLVKLRNPYTLKTAAPKIAVLIGSNTSSSGEMTTISFIGKPNTRLFGQPSGGYTTANGMYKLPGGSTLLLANSYCADRNGKTYKGKIQPDELVAEQDDAIAAATQWLDAN